jgi:C4-dicarboxylate-specific signal transduction histidine kinase
MARKPAPCSAAFALCSRKRRRQKTGFDLSEAIHELTIFLRDEAMRHHISMRTDLAPDLPKIKADRVQLQQVVLNLMMNGMDAMAEVAGGPRDLIISSRKEKSAVVVTVEDCGFGLDAEAAGKIFDPFFTTKSHGIGMGLSISRSIVESHEGSKSPPTPNTRACTTTIPWPWRLKNWSGDFTPRTERYCSRNCCASATDRRRAVGASS